MKRCYDERHITFRNWQNHPNLHRQSNIDRGKSPEDIDCVCDEQMGRFRKRDAYDCGKTQCVTCHYDKALGIKSQQERIADLDFREQVGEYCLANQQL